MTDPADNHQPATMPNTARYLGHAGLLPQIACLIAMLVADETWRFNALMLAHTYAALIFTFLGGLWWGIAAAGSAQGRSVPDWLYWAAIAPSLVALASFIPLWLIGLTWIGPMLLLLGLCLMASPLVDKRLTDFAPEWWLKLRWPLSVRLGGLSVILGIIAWGI
jgi:hypothetical protein